MKIQHVNGQKVCWGTDPFVPNMSGNARSRVLHLEHLSRQRFNFPATQCGKRISEFVTVNEYGRLGRKMCVQCTVQSEAWKNKNQEGAYGNTRTNKDSVSSAR